MLPTEHNNRCSFFFSLTQAPSILCVWLVKIFIAWTISDDGEHFVVSYGGTSTNNVYVYIHSKRLVVFGHLVLIALLFVIFPKAYTRARSHTPCIRRVQWHWLRAERKTRLCVPGRVTFSCEKSNQRLLSTHGLIGDIFTLVVCPIW